MAPHATARPYGALGCSLRNHLLAQGARWRRHRCRRRRSLAPPDHGVRDAPLELAAVLPDHKGDLLLFHQLKVGCGGRGAAAAGGYPKGVRARRRRRRRALCRRRQRQARVRVCACLLGHGAVLGRCTATPLQLRGRTAHAGDLQRPLAMRGLHRGNAHLPVSCATSRGSTRACHPAASSGDSRGARAAAQLRPRAQLSAAAAARQAHTAGTAATGSTSRGAGRPSPALAATTHSAHLPLLPSEPLVLLRPARKPAVRANQHQHLHGCMGARSLNTQRACMARQRPLQEVRGAAGHASPALTPPSLTSEGRRARKRWGSGSRHSRLAASTAVRGQGAGVRR